MPVAGSAQPRRYQRSLSKHSTKLNRYSTSGSSHRKGIAAMFCVMWLVTASSSHEPVADSSSHSAWRCQGGGGSAAGTGPGALACACGAVNA